MERVPTQPVLKRFDITVYKNKDGTTDPPQVPAQAKIEFYRQGATVKVAPPTITPTDFTTVTVYNTGDILQTHIVQREMEEAITMDVGVVNEAEGTIQLKSRGGNIVLTIGQRLIDTSSPPSAYKDPLGTIADGTGNSVTTNSTTGRYGGYMRAYRYDYIVKIPPTSPTETRLYIDSEGSFVMR